MTQMDLHYKTFGQGPPLIILHGLLGSLDNWQSLGKQLAESHTVFLVDQRNHGRSPHHEEIDYALMAEDLREFMEKHWIYEAVLLGHSMGGKTAMRFALDHPDMVERLIVVDIAPRAYPPHHQHIFDALLAIDLSKAESRQAVEEALVRILNEPASMPQFLMKNLTREKDGRFRWKMNLPALHRQLGRLMEEIRAEEPCDKPALFVRGALSNYVADDDLRDIQALFPRARLETAAGAGHWVHADAPERLLELITDFLAEGV
jgi:esterase